jgi:hypothetical protein
VRFLTPVVGLLLLSLPLLLLVWGFRTCRTLWRRGTTPWGRLVYNYGVRGFGAMMAVFFVVAGAYFGATGFGDSGTEAIRGAAVWGNIGGTLWHTGRIRHGLFLGTSDGLVLRTGAGCQRVKGIGSE